MCPMKQFTTLDTHDGIGIVDVKDLIPDDEIENVKEQMYSRGANVKKIYLPYGNWEWLHFHGRHTMERLPERAPLIHGIQESSNARGTSSHQQNPSFIICSPDCGERYGECYGAFFVYSGSFQTQI